MSIETALAALEREPRYRRNVVAVRSLPAQPARCRSFPAALDPRLVAALQRQGVPSLYSHQAAAVSAALDGRHVTVVTPAASGKTLCYNLPTLHRLLQDPQARALYLFPTKALAQDQLAVLEGLIAAVDQGPAAAGPAEGRQGQEPALPLLRISAPPLPVAVYDGDTPAGRRSSVRERARIVLSNPDMLHAGILPQHARWAAFFANLRVVVIDEMHAYRGVFGSHVANVLRRLRRICDFYGAAPQFMLASATIANPGELAGRLVEAPVAVVGPDANGAPRGERVILLYNPPVVDAGLGLRRASRLEAADLAAHFLAHGVQTIVFAGGRLTTELVLGDLRRQAADPTAVHGYRSGYLPRERRAIERGLRSGQVRVVVATTALELGIDIGQLEAAVLIGYPGTIAAAAQQMGRAGRRQGPAAAVMVANPSPLDQYILAHPEYLFERSPERALINPDNPVILSAHLTCAAAELPFTAGEGFGAALRVAETLAFLAQEGELYCAGDRYYWSGQGYPAAAISLRSSAADRVIIQAGGPDERPYVVGEVDRAGAPLLLYEGAVYLHGGDSYLVERLDWEGGVAHVRPAEVEYYTRASLSTEVEVVAARAGRDCPLPLGDCAVFDKPPPAAVPPLSAFQGAAAGVPPSLPLSWGDLRVTTRAGSYRVLHRQTHAVLGFAPIDLPAQVLETAGCWLAFPAALTEELKATGGWYSDPNEYGPNWGAQRTAARARDGHCCHVCGMAEAPGRQHHVHHRVPFRAFVADAALRPGLAADEAWQAANQLPNLVTLCPVCHQRVEASVRLRSGLGGTAALLGGLAPLYLMCDADDLGVSAEAQAAGSGLPTITIYEQVPAGIGYAAELFSLMPALLQAARDVVAGCACERGCPACVGPVPEHEYALDTKALTLALLNRVCGEPTGDHSVNNGALPAGAGML